MVPPYQFSGILVRVSQNASLADYRTALTAPGARGPVLTSLLARLPVAMVGIALLFYVQRVSGSFAAASLVSAGALVGVAVGSVLQGRLVDLLGPTRVLLTASALFSVMVTAEILAIESGAPAWLMAVLALALGTSQPMVGSSSRSLWTRLLPPGSARQAAYSYEAISMEVFFILGPGLAGLFTALPWAGTGVLLGAVCEVVGATGFALTRTVRAWRPQREERASVGMLGAISSPGMRTVAIAALGFGVTIGFVEVAVPAAATHAGHEALGGVLLSVWSVSSVLFGVLYGSRPWPKPMYLRLPVLLGGFSVLVTLLAIPTTLVGLAVALFVVGTLITPQAMTHSAAIEEVALPGTATEAFGWVITAVTVGLAFGQLLSGQLIELFGPPAAFLASAFFGLVITGVVWLRRHSVRDSRQWMENAASCTRDEVELAAR